MKNVKVFSHEIMPLISERINQNQEVYLTVSGTSMRPFYHHQKTIVKLVKPTFPIDLYTVCLFNDQGIYKLHRFIKKTNDLMIMNGDALKTNETIRFDQIIGVVTEHEYKNKKTKSSSKRYLLNVRIWSLLRPFRRVMLRIFGGE